MDTCPGGYAPIQDEISCMLASTALELSYDPAMNARVGQPHSVCNWCGGCEAPTARVDDDHGVLARWICSAPAPTPAPTQAPAAPTSVPAPVQSPLLGRSAAEFVLGDLGADSCPTGHLPIHEEVLCSAASSALGLAYDSVANARVGRPSTVCNLCGGCTEPTTRMDDEHGVLSRWLCEAAAPAPAPAGALGRSGGNYDGTVGLPMAAPYALGELGADSCPVEYAPILDGSACASASDFLGLVYDASMNAHVGQAYSLCNWCGGCEDKTSRVDDGHGDLAKWLCMA